MPVSRRRYVVNGHIWRLLVSTLLVAAPWCAQQPRPTAAAPKPQAQDNQQNRGRGQGNQQRQEKPVGLEPAKLEGFVLSTSGERLRKTTIQLIALQWRDQPIATTTDAEGKFSFPDLTPGAYRISADKPGFIYAKRTVGGGVPGPGPGGPMGGFGGRGGEVITLLPGQTQAGYEIKMMPQAVISGRVLDEDGEPAANVAVRAMQWRWSAQGRELQAAPGSVGMARTNELGEFRLPGLRGGRYVLAAEPMMSFGPGVRRAVRNTANPAAAPVEAQVTTYYPSATQEDAAGELIVPSGQEFPGVEIRLRKSAVYSVRGVVSGVQDARNTRVMLMRAGSMNMSGMRGAAVEADGSFALSGVAPGQYEIRMFGPGGPGRMAMASAGTTVTVSTQDVEGVSVVPAAPIATINGTITGVDPKTTDLTKVRIALESTEPGMMFGGAAAANVADSGTFALQNVASNRYRLRVTGLPAGAYLKSVRSSGLEHVNEFNASDPNLQVTIATDGGTVSGSVKNSEGKVAAEGYILLLAADGKPDSAWRNKRAQLTDGAFNIASVPPGEYVVVALSEYQDGVEWDPLTRPRVLSAGKSVRVTENGTVSADLVLADSSAILGGQ